LDEKPLDMNATIHNLVSVIVVNWNGERYIKQCLASVMKQTYPNIETIVVDNGSHDKSVATIKNYFSEVRLITLARNYGFAKANTIGLKEAQGEFICLLNNDAVAHAKWVQELTKAAKARSEVAACASKMLNYRHRKIIDSAGDGYTRMGFPDKIGTETKNGKAYDHAREVLSACAGAALYRRSAIEGVGFFDEDFFAYLEDIDLALRINRAGYTCLYVPTAVVYHHGSASSGSKINPFTIYWSTRNYLPVIIKNLPAALIARYIPFMVAWQLYWIIACVKKKVLRAYLKGMWDALRPRFFLTMLQRRKTLKKLWRTPNQELHRRIVRAEREIFEGIYRKRMLQGRPYASIKAYLKLFHGSDL
jgi:GT2 family glycosyltransferase